MSTTHLHVQSRDRKSTSIIETDLRIIDRNKTSLLRKSARAAVNDPVFIRRVHLPAVRSGTVFCHRSDLIICCPENIVPLDDPRYLDPIMLPLCISKEI